MTHITARLENILMKNGFLSEENSYTDDSFVIDACKRFNVYCMEEVPMKIRSHASNLPAGPRWKHIPGLGKKTMLQITELSKLA